MKKYRIKNREEMLEIHSEAHISDWDREIQELLGTIQEGEKDRDGDLELGGFYWGEEEVEEIIQVPCKDPEISDLIGKARLGKGTTTSTLLVSSTTIPNKSDLLNVQGITTDVGGLPQVSTEYTDKHYDFYYDLTEEEILNKRIKVDPYFVAKQWKLGEKDPSGCLFHIMKNSSRFGVKNSAEREIKALKDIIKRLEELNK